MSAHITGIKSFRSTAKKVREEIHMDTKVRLTLGHDSSGLAVAYPMQDIPDYTPELNGTAGVNIHAIMNMMHSMIKGAQ